MVLGWLRDGIIDSAALDAVLGHCRRVTFHRAFAQAASPEAALAELRARPAIDRLLASGDAAYLTRLAQEAQPQIQVIAGGGLTEQAIAELARTTSLREFHCGSAARENGRVRAAKVRRLVQAANRVV